MVIIIYSTWIIPKLTLVIVSIYGSSFFLMFLFLGWIYIYIGNKVRVGLV